MKALVLSGGSGSRLRPITHTLPKQLVPVVNKPVLFYGLEAIRDAGIVDVGIVVGDTAGSIAKAVGDGQRFGLEVTYIHQGEALGLAHAVAVAGDYLADHDFVMYLGDNFLADGLTSLVEQFSSDRPHAQLLLTRVDNPRAFGVAELDAGGDVVSLVEKPEQPRSDLALVGAYAFTPAIHDAVRRICPSQRGELEITDAIRTMLNGGNKVRAAFLSGYWQDTGNVADVLDLNRVLLRSTGLRLSGDVDSATEIIGDVLVEAGANVRRSVIHGPVVIGKGAVVSDSRIGPFTALGEECLVVGSEVGDSILLRASSLTGVRRVQASLIGTAARVTSRGDVG